MARSVNKKATLKKQCKEHELNIKESLKLQGINYHASALELDVRKMRGHIISYVYEAITDVKNNAFEFIDDEFCVLHGLPTIDRFHDELSDTQALFISLIVSELYPDIDALLEKQPNTAMLLFPALARDKLNKARSAIENDNVENAELRIEEVRCIAEMIVIVHRYFNPAPYKSLNEEKQQHNKKVSDMRRELVKKTRQYDFSVKLRALVDVYVKGVIELFSDNELELDSHSITLSCLKGIETQSNPAPLDLSILDLFDRLEESYMALYESDKLNKGDNDKGCDIELEDVLLNPATFRRHVVDIVSQLLP
ncbi:Putative uncharacterized protein [Moritella viscosa]|uniref:hypothetical protein n=1 Tax=Moritella viscosa TaxID=80854 RepID=UPI00050923F0|nr:hypothetical protein [Moritella viscosa]CED61884.1 putative uncharacterized protein [Moritella viscosa]SHO07401.1 Putative uncharacterized protein [Moritella viscosa]SHO21893.1 Putative uncharacterized protein [Moritella viscosa]